MSPASRIWHRSTSTFKLDNLDDCSSQPLKPSSSTAAFCQRSCQWEYKEQGLHRERLVPSVCATLTTTLIFIPCTACIFLAFNIIFVHDRDRDAHHQAAPLCSCWHRQLSLTPVTEQIPGAW
ncbi:hypothetical protein BDW22DRAFT_1091192 [Trametopsis cervina]|nr:hypothetical protein BDW22DRAFT_1091192 [Trametopsis cervina]